ncbi:MAG TPA: DUF1080 domain-containing protein [Opitutae bacterium]|nr:DUF1080 domain-containing protein [Opitutae bacterium]
MNINHLGILSVFLLGTLLAEDREFVSLFNGKDLNGWKTTGNWLPQDDGSLLIKPKPDQKGWQRYSDYLISEEKFGDFILELEYKYPPKGNSGVFFRIGNPKDPVQTGIECQILDSTGKPDDKMGAHDHGGIIRTVGPRVNISKQAGEWNHMVINCQGHHLRVALNGVEIINHWMDSISEDKKLTGVGDRPLKGHIGLQDHGTPNNIYFRNIRIRNL